jgi:hypothetical protein
MDLSTLQLPTLAKGQEFTWLTVLLLSLRTAAAAPASTSEQNLLQ